MIQIERISLIINELAQLAKIHHEEIYPFDMEFAPDWDRYEQLDQNGMIQVVTARAKGGELVGYNINLVTTDMHHKNDLFAINDSIYLHPDYRGSGMAKKLIEFSEFNLKAMGVKLAHISVKKEHDFSKLLKRMDYTEHEIVFVKEL